VQESPLRRGSAGEGREWVWRWRAGGELNMALCGCGRPPLLAGERGVGGWGKGFAPQERRNWALADNCSQARYPLLGGFRSELRRATTGGGGSEQPYQP